MAGLSFTPEYPGARFWRLAALGAVAVFAVLKLPYLALPSFWDDAWVYAPAIRALHETGPTLLPGTITDDLTRGHPLLFHFLGSIWLSVFGPSNLALHAYALAVGVALLAVTARVASQLYGPCVGFWAVLLLGAHSMIFVQSALALPELMLALWALLAVSAFANQKWWWAVFWATLMLYTKESGVVVLVGLVVTTVGHGWLARKPVREWGRTLLHALAVAGVSIALVAIHFIVQKNRLGYVFFPEHLGYLVDDLGAVVKAFGQLSNILLVQYGVGVLMLALMVIVVMARFRKRPPTYLEVFAGVFTLGFLAFSALNFQTHRYLSIILPFLTIAGLGGVFQVLGAKHLRVAHVLAGVLVLSVGTSTLTRDNVGDTSLHYTDQIAVRIKAIQYLHTRPGCDTLQSNGTFLLYTATQVPGAGYGADTLCIPWSPGGTIAEYHLRGVDFLVNTAAEPTSAIADYAAQHPRQLILEKRLEQGPAWAEIWRFTSAP